MSTNEKTLVVFYSLDDKFKLPEASILLPVSLKPAGLSEIINSILSTSKNFDFIIDGKFLKSSIHQYLEQNSLSAENTTRIQVVESQEPPQLQQSLEQDDWISTIKINPTTGDILVGSFDSFVKVFSLDGDLKCSISNSRFSIKSAIWLNQNMMAVGDAQCNIAGYRIQNQELQSCFSAVGHNGSIEAMESFENFLVTGSYDKSIKLWDITAEKEAFVPKKSAKKQKMNEASILRTTSTLSGHNDVVSGLKYDHSSKQLFSISWDHSIRIWDLETSTNTKTLVKNH